MRPEIFGLGTLLAAFAAPALGQISSPLKLDGYVKLEKVVVDEHGEPRVEQVEPEAVVPGDRLIMGTRYRNEGTAPIEKIVVSNPVPAAVRVAEVPDPQQIVSVDGGKSWGPFALQVVLDENGNDRTAEPGEITHLRWAIANVAPGSGGTVEYTVAVR